MSVHEKPNALEQLLTVTELSRGYLRDPRATKADMLDGGWYKTGDLGYLNDDDYLVVNGRTKDTIKYNG